MTRRECLCQLGGAAVFALSPQQLFADTATGDVPAAARFWHREGAQIRCELCPHSCLLNDKKTGLCRNRYNNNGELQALGYGVPCALNVDPIEKKPFYHALPGSTTYSIGVAGCNLRCRNCQNYTISQKGPRDVAYDSMSPRQIAAAAEERHCPVVAFTYTEPLVWIEYAIDCAEAARLAGIRTALISAGYVNAAPFSVLARHLDFARFDLKSFSDVTYRKLNAGRLQPVLDTILAAKKAGVWVEIINLVIPGWNDADADLRSLCRWVREYCGVDTPLHFSRFFPMYQLSHAVPTPVAALRRAVACADAEGLHYPYIGNVTGEGATTVCPSCKKHCIVRDGYRIVENTMKKGSCSNCGTVVAGVWGDV